MALGALDWLIVAAYGVFALWVGLRYSARAGRDPDEFFLTGRSLPWWMAGTSMIATTFAADTPLVVTGWVREFGIWKNWLWWCFILSTSLTVFAFAPYWRRAGVMTTAELSELRYGGREAGLLRGFLGFYHAGITNTLVLCWVLLAAIKIFDVLFGVDPLTAAVLACALAMGYSLLAGLWGVVLTDMVQFVMAMVGAVVLAWLAWEGVGGLEGVRADAAASDWNPEVFAFLPASGPGGPLELGFWTTTATALAVYLGVQWWAKDGVDGGGYVVQRIAATKDVRAGVFAALWYQVGTFALRPWPWIAVALASLVVLPPQEIASPVEGVVTSVSAGSVTIDPDGEGPQAPQTLQWGAEGDWVPLAQVKVEQAVEAGDVIAATDSERAYPAMMRRYLPAGLLGLVVASLLAAFMSTIDTHVNLAASYFVNDVYRRFVRPDAEGPHYVLVARLASVAILFIGATFALFNDSIGDLFVFFLAFLGGVGPVYVLRWWWWRVRAGTEIAAMVASSLLASLLTVFAGGISWGGELYQLPLGPLTPGGVLSAEGRLCLVVLGSLLTAAITMAVQSPPDPQKLVEFYRRVRPIGLWGPVRRLAPEVEPAQRVSVLLAGFLGANALTFGVLFGMGHWLLDNTDAAGWCLFATLVGAMLLVWALGRARFEAQGEA